MTGAAYSTSIYWRNNEAFANNFVETAAAAFKVNISTYVNQMNASATTTGGSSWIDPAIILISDGGTIPK